ncbi:SGNH hydrolase [Coniochaeta sp. PMI_546]|nr:SGNH hydrolase [Coniochaeta sp. PMI_546]
MARFWRASWLMAVVVMISTGAAQSPTIKIMPLGDSITGSPGCWRALLWRKLQDAKITNTDFVGTLPAQGCGFTYDGENEGHGGYLATGIVSNKQLPGWLSKTNPDVVMMHLGTNDVWNNKSPDEILAAFSTLLGQMRDNKKTMKVLVAQIIPMNPPNCAQCAQRVIALNKAIPDWAAAKNTTESPITVVDCWTGFDDAKDTNDGVHPNSSGNQKMANCWFDPLVRVLKG